MKKNNTYNIINNSLGWLCFIIAAVTYLLTLEPTASFWDCPEFISQGFKLEVGHPPGNPVFMLAARFCINLVGGSVQHVAVAVNAMSAILSALTILLLFWTITHLVRKLVVRDKDSEISLAQMLVIFGAGLCGALMYTWSDTFWFSAVEGEVYAFSSFCTALVFWLILKWENRADQPHSDRYLVLIAYVIGISIAVHLLNLLCIPAIVLVIYYKKFANPNAKGSLLALLVSFVIVALILFGLVPGFIEVSQYFELFFVNKCHLGYNMGVLIYAIMLVGCFIWGTYELYAQRSSLRIKISFALSVLLSGIPFIGNAWWIPVVIMAALITYLCVAKTIKVRILNLALLSIFVIFIGYSSYALLLIRSSANPPMNQNEPDNVFSLSSYLNREQYGQTPLLYGRTPYSTTVYKSNGSAFESMVKDGKPKYNKIVKSSPDQRDEYVFSGYEQEAVLTPELNMIFPRIYSGQYVDAYKGWIGLDRNEPLGNQVLGTIAYDADGNPLRQEYFTKPTFGQSLQYFFNYQLNHMYWRYFMWNFAGRQNDIQGNGEVNHGNWITGIPFIDNPRLGDQSLLPDDLGAANKGHNVFFLLPLLMGIFGILWQAYLSKRGIEQFWVVFFLFFMTGIAIVLYLNQTPSQPRERDYAFAGSFYAYAIWVGMGVPAIASALSRWFFGKKNKPAAKEAQEAAVSQGYDAVDTPTGYYNLSAAIIALFVGIIVPLQVVSQTWDDHDRSGRYAARDFGFNYLNSLDENAIIFTNGDNDTFPLWYAQEVEGERTDVKVVNLSYLTTDWYANQVKHPSYNAPAIKTLARPQDYAYEELQYSIIVDDNDTPTDALETLGILYSSQRNPRYGVHDFPRSKVFIPSNLEGALAAGRITPEELPLASDSISIDLLADPYIGPSRGMTLSNVISLDIIASSIADGWKRPTYFASTVPEEYYMSLTPYMRSTGMAYEISPIYTPSGSNGASSGVNTDKMYRNVTEKFRWGGIDKAKDAKDIYLDESVRRMVSSTRGQLLDLAYALYSEGMDADNEIKDKGETPQLKERRSDRFDKAVTILNLMSEKLPPSISPFSIQMGKQTGDLYVELGRRMNNPELTLKGRQILRDELTRYAQHVIYYQSLKPWQFATLQNTDLYAYHYYLIDLMQSLLDSGATQQEILDIPGMERIDFNRLQGGY